MATKKKMQSGGTSGGYPNSGENMSPGMKMGGTKKYQDGGRTINEKAAMRKVGKGKGTIAYKYGSDSAPGTEGNKGEYIGYSKKARKDSASGKTIGTSMKDSKTSRPVMKTGGMVNPKAATSNVARGRSGGTSAAPKTALPKAQMGKIVKMASNAAKVAGKSAKKASGSILDFRKAATKSDMSEALKRAERAKLKKQLQDLEKSRKG